MALTITKAVSLRGISTVKDTAGNDVQVAMFDAQISTDGAQTYNNMTILNQELYLANKVSVRKDKADFDSAVWGAEDLVSTKPVV